MSPQAPQERGHAKNPATGHGRGLRRLPGFTVAAVAFFVIVILGIGGVAVANWSQSAKVTIGVTAGAAPTTAAPVPTKPAPTVPPVVPTTAPTIPVTPPVTQPPAAQVGNIVVKPVIASRPGLLALENVTCSRASNSKDFTINWAGDASSYVVSLSASDTNFGSPQSTTVNVKTAKFTLANTQAAYGSYVLRILPIKGTVAGDPIYKVLKHYETYWACDWTSPDGRSPLGAFSVTASPASRANTNNVLNVTWAAAAKATGYKVSIKANASSYGAEFATPSLGATLTFPPYILDKAGYPTNDGAFIGEYMLRVIPMNGTQAGDPVYKKVIYKAYDFRVENFQFYY